MCVSLWTGKNIHTDSFCLRERAYWLSLNYSATGEPRGFAHADFLDVESAVKAKEKLADAEVYGRRLRIDFSGNRREGGFNRGRRDDRQGGRSEYQQRDRQQGQFANHRSYTPRSEVPE